MKLSAAETKALGYMVEAVPALAICIVTAGIMSIVWIYAMSNCATGIAYVVIGICELMLVGFILAGLSVPEEEKNAGMALIVVGIIMLVVFNAVLFCKWKNI